MDVCGRSNTIQHDDPARSNTQRHGMDAGGRINTKVGRTSKPVPGILGDVGGTDRSRRAPANLLGASYLVRMKDTPKMM